MDATISKVPASDQDALAVLRAAALAPQFSWQRGWHIVCLGSRGLDWTLLATDNRATLTQAQLVSAGSTAQLLVIGKEAQGRRVDLEVLPDDDAACVVRVRDDGPGPAARARELLLAPDPAARRELHPSDLRHLNLAAESFGCELLWQDDPRLQRAGPGLRRVAATSDRRPLTTIVTSGDGPRDWIAAGRAGAQCSLIGRSLGLELSFGVHAFNGWAAREEIHGLWELRGWPQLQFWVEAPPTDRVD